MLNASELYRTSFRAGLKPDPDLLLSDWADEYRILPKTSSKESGQYRTSRTPYLKEPMDRLSPNDPCQHVVIVKGTQLGFTTVGENLLFCVAHLYPGPCLMLLPTGDLLKRLSKNRITPSLKAMECLNGKIKDPRKRDSGNTIDQKSFPGGFWRFGTSNSGAALRSDPIRYLILDDRDGFDLEIPGEGEPGELAKKRTDTYAKSKKIYENSTPTEEGTSRIEKSFELSSQAFFYLPCPYCGERFKMDRTGFKRRMKYSIDDSGTVVDDSVYWECEKCKSEIKEYHKSAMLAGGEWIHTHPARPIKGYCLPSLYSPVGWVSWAQICDEYLKALDSIHKKDPRLMRVWVNTRMAAAWAEKLDGAEANVLYERREDYGPVIPSGGLVLTCAVDVQDNRLEAEVMAWGIGFESWGIDYEVIEGDPALPKTWGKLDKYLSKSWEHESGLLLRVQACAIDCGYLSDEVYQYCGPRWGRRIFAVKGASQTTAGALPIIEDKAKVTKYNARRFQIGTNTAKDQWARWLKVVDPGPGCCHFPAYYTPEWFGMVTAEKIRKRFQNGYLRREWIKVNSHARNEALDIRVYNLAAVKHLNPSFGAIKRKIEAFKPDGKPEDREPKQRPKKRKKSKRRSAGGNAWGG